MQPVSAPPTSIVLLRLGRCSLPCSFIMENTMRKGQSSRVIKTLLTMEKPKVPNAVNGRAGTRNHATCRQCISRQLHSSLTHLRNRRKPSDFQNHPAVSLPSSTRRQSCHIAVICALRVQKTRRPCVIIIVKPFFLPLRSLPNSNVSVTIRRKSDVLQKRNKFGNFAQAE